MAPNKTLVFVVDAVEVKLSPEGAELIVDSQNYAGSPYLRQASFLEQLPGGVSYFDRRLAGRH